MMLCEDMLYHRIVRRHISSHCISNRLFSILQSNTCRLVFWNPPGYFMLHITISHHNITREMFSIWGIYLCLPHGMESWCFLNRDVNHSHFGWTWFSPFLPAIYLNMIETGKRVLQNRKGIPSFTSTVSKTVWNCRKLLLLLCVSICHAEMIRVLGTIKWMENFKNKNH